MRKFTPILLIAAMVIPVLTANALSPKVAQERESLIAPFPAAAPGMVRHTIYMEKKTNEDDYKIEIIPGKILSVDNNVHRLMGTMEEKNVDGWGYTYYEFTSTGQTASTLMASTGPNSERFVWGRTIMLDYNSKLPVVVYAPEGFEVRYRIWKAGKTRISYGL